MKVVSRSLLILLVFGLIAGMMVVAVNGVASLASSMGLLEDERASEISIEQIEVDARPPQPDRDRNDGQSLFELLSRWILSVGKNVFILGILVVMIVLPRNVLSKPGRSYKK